MWCRWRIALKKLPQLANFSAMRAKVYLSWTARRPKNECFKNKKRSCIKTTSITCGAGGRGRTDTSCYGPRILSPVRLPFRHTGILRLLRWESVSHSNSIKRILEAPTRFELVMRVLQTRALPLGDGAIMSMIGAGGRGRTDTDG